MDNCMRGKWVICDMTEQQAYELGYREGLERRAEQIEHLKRELEAWRKRYDYLLQLQVDALNVQPLAPIIIKKGE